MILKYKSPISVCPFITNDCYLLLQFSTIFYKVLFSGICMKYRTKNATTVLRKDHPQSVIVRNPLRGLIDFLSKFGYHRYRNFRYWWYRLVIKSVTNDKWSNGSYIIKYLFVSKLFIENQGNLSLIRYLLNNLNNYKENPEKIPV